MKFLKSFIGRLIIRYRLRRHRIAIFKMMAAAFLFARESKSDGYDFAWVANQIYSKCESVELSDELKSAINIALAYGFKTNVTYEEFYNLIKSDWDNIHKDVMRTIDIA